MQLVHTWSDLIKDMVRYYEEQHKRHKTVSMWCCNSFHEQNYLQEFSHIMSLYRTSLLIGLQCFSLPAGREGVDPIHLAQKIGWEEVWLVFILWQRVGPWVRLPAEVGVMPSSGLMCERQWLAVKNEEYLKRTLPGIADQHKQNIFQ